ncbi:MAG: hypothetical protein H8E55_40920 [Pelagibacterales bacterium]|nr:hypothetical protein [Pelagibacterales bacterium]
MANFATVDALQFQMDDLNPISQSKKPKHLKKPLKSGDGEKRKIKRIDKHRYKEFVADVGKDLASKGSKGLKDDDDKVTNLIEKIERQNKNAKSQPTVKKKAPEKIIIPREFRDSDSDNELFAADYKSFNDMDGGRKTRKKSKVFRHNLRKNKISRKYIMLKQCGGAKAKKGAKSNPFSSKAKASRSRRKGSCYYKKKGRTLKMSKSSGKKKGTKKRRKSRRRRR